MNLDFDEDSKLAAGIQKGSLKAFEQLYNKYKSKLYFFSFKHVNDQFDAEEIVQIVFVNIWEHRETLDGNLSLRSYLYTSTVNLVFNVLKKRSIRLKYMEKELLEEEKSVNTTYDQIYLNELECKLDAIISNLPAQQKKILNLNRFDGLSNVEIADKLDLSVRTVENQIYRATKFLRDQLKKEVSD